MNDKYKRALDTLIGAQELIINYSRKDMWNSIWWGITFALITVFGTDILWLRIGMLILAGIHFHTAMREHEFTVIFRNDLERIKSINPNSTEQEEVL